MNMPLLYIQPQTLNFAVALKKQSSCVLRLTNQYVAFKVKTTSLRPNVGVQRTPSWMKSFQTRRGNRRIIAFALDTSSSSGDDTSGLGSTRLGRIATAGGKLLLLKLNSARQNFPMKIFLLLLGFYTANALATILGQTGDWDVLVAGIVVAAIEGIGMLMYKKKKKPSSSTFSAKFQSFVVLMNFWKAGVCLGLFVDAFKLGS